MRTETELVRKTGAVIAVQGKILVGEGDETLSKSVDDVLSNQPGIHYIILDITGVPYVDSIGLGTLVRAYIEATKRSVKLVFCGIQPKIRNLLVITKLLGVFEIYETQKEAREEMARRF